MTFGCLVGGVFLSAAVVHIWEKQDLELEEGTVLKIATVTSDFRSRQCLLGTGSYDAIGTQ